MNDLNPSQPKIDFLPEILRILENTGYGICLIDTSQKILWANKVIKRWYPNKQITDSYLYQIFNFTEHTSKDFILDAFVGKEVIIFEEFDNEANNWYLFSAVLLSRGEENQILLIIEEITEKKSLLEQYVSQLEILDNVEDGIYYVNFQNEVLYWNKGAEKIYGYSAEEVLGHTINLDFKLYDEIDVETLIQMTKELEIYHHYYFQREEYTKAREKIWIEGSVAMIYSLEKKPQGLLFIVRDITSRRNAEEEIVLNNQLKSSLNEISLLLLNDVNEDKIINEILLKCKLLIKCDLCFIITPDKKEQDFNELYFEATTSDGDKKELLELKENIKSIFHWIALNDTYYHQDATMDNELGLSFIKKIGLQEFVVYPAKLKQEIVGLFFIGNKNSSLHKKVNDILSAFANAYVSVVDYIREKKFRELLEEKLNQSQKLETAAAIISGIVHDFNNILTGVKAGITNLMNKEELENYRTNLLDLNQLLNRGTDLAKRLINLGKPEPPKKTKFKVEEFLNEIHSFAKQIFPKSTHINFSIPKALPELVADYSSLHQVFVNLCVNAKDAMKSNGKFNINVELVNITENEFKSNPTFKVGKFIKFSISDSGEGIDEKHLKKIFEPYFTTKGKDKGSGLGLFVVYNIIKKHDGFINVRSKLGEGTTFEIYLPYEDLGASLPKSKITKGEKFRILLADDEKSIRELLSEMLTLQGYEVYQAESKKDVLESINLLGAKLNLLILDYYLSDANADEILNNLKAMNKSIPTFIATGVQDDSILNRLKNLNVVKIIEKPYEFDTILNSINEIIKLSNND